MFEMKSSERAAQLEGSSSPASTRLDLSRRLIEPEIMDSEGLSRRAHREALRGLARLNRLSAAHPRYWRQIRRLTSSASQAPLRVLDVACGGGDVAIGLAHSARAAGARTSSAVSQALGTELARVEAMKVALSRATAAPGDLDERLNSLRTRLMGLEEELYGNRAKGQVGEKTRPSVGSRLSAVELGLVSSTYGPTPTHRQTLEIANAQLQQIKSDLEEARAEVAALGEDLQRAGAPWVEGVQLPG